MLKLFKPFFLFCLSCCFLSCVKIQDKKTVIKVGARAWTLKEVRDYFQFRLSGYSTPVDSQKLKKEILNEIFFISFVENWAKRNEIQIQTPALTQEKRSFSKAKLKILKSHKDYMSLYSFLLRKLADISPEPTLKEQKDFYNKNKSRFTEPALCNLKQILVKKKKLAQSLQDRIKKGEDFDTLNQIYSLQKHPGWVKKGSLEVFDRACFKEDSPNSILKSPYGYHIFLVQGQKSRRQKSFLQARKLIIQALKAKKAKGQFQIWLKEQTLKNPLWTDKKYLDRIQIQYKTGKT